MTKQDCRYTWTNNLLFISYRHNPDKKDHVAGQQKEDGDFVDPFDVEAHLRRRHERTSRREGGSDALSVMRRVVATGLESILILC